MAQSRQDMPHTIPASHLMDLPSGVDDDVALLARLIYQLQQALIPVSPAESFRANLRHDLLMAAHEQQRQNSQTRRRLTSPWALLAAGVASAVSVVVGIITYVVWHRTRTVTS